VNDLRGRVNSGVRAARGGDFDGMTGDLGERGLQVILRRAAARLRLPTAERGPVVLQAQSDAHDAPRGPLDSCLRRNEPSMMLREGPWIPAYAGMPLEGRDEPLRLVLL